MIDPQLDPLTSVGWIVSDFQDLLLPNDYCWWPGDLGVKSISYIWFIYLRVDDLKKDSVISTTVQCCTTGRKDGSNSEEDTATKFNHLQCSLVSGFSVQSWFCKLLWLVPKYSKNLTVKVSELQNESDSLVWKLRAEVSAHYDFQKITCVLFNN